MKQEYDFSKGERGKFFRENARLNLPVYLDEEVLSYLQERAKSKGVEVAKLVIVFLSDFTFDILTNIEGYICTVLVNWYRRRCGTPCLGSKYGRQK